MSLSGDPELDRVLEVQGAVPPPEVGQRVLEILSRKRGANPASLERVSSWCHALARRLRGEPMGLPADPLQRPTILYLEGFEDRAWHDPLAHAVTASLEAAATTIRAELFEGAAAPTRWQEYAEGVADHKWRARWFYRHGLRQSETAALFPRSQALLDAHSGPGGPLASTLGDCFISRLEPKGHIPAHTGLCNVSLVCHLALAIPPQCRFRVGTSTRAWEEGKCLVFDDTFEHEAWNDSDQDRYLLVVPLWQNGVSPLEREFMQIMTHWLNRLTSTLEGP